MSKNNEIVVGNIITQIQNNFYLQDRIYYFNVGGAGRCD